MAAVYSRPCEAAETDGPCVPEDAALVVVATIEGVLFEREGSHVFQFVLNGEPVAERGVAVVASEGDEE
jgi:hypothetical protein